MELLRFGQTMDGSHGYEFAFDLGVFATGKGPLDQEVGGRKGWAKTDTDNAETLGLSSTRRKGKLVWSDLRIDQFNCEDPSRAHAKGDI